MGKEYKRKRLLPNRSSKLYDDTFRRAVVKAYLDTDRSMLEVAKIYGVAKVDVSNWKKRFSSELRVPQKLGAMTEEEKKNQAALEARIKLLEKKLEYEQMRNFALETMADLAKEKLGIDIRKNFGAKQPKE